MTKQQRLYAFWRYDLFPFYCGGEVTKMRPGGMVYVAAYQGCFRPIKIVSLEEGLAVQRQLNALEAEYRSEKKKLKNRYGAKLRDLFPETAS